MLNAVAATAPFVTSGGGRLCSQFWGRRNSSNVQKVMWAIGELGSALRANRRGPGIRRQRHARLSGDESDRACADAQRRRFYFVGIQFDRPVSRQPLRAGRAGAGRPESPRSRQSMDGLADVGISCQHSGTFFTGSVRTPPEKRNYAAIAEAKTKSCRVGKNLRCRIGAQCLCRGRHVLAWGTFRWVSAYTVSGSLFPIGRRCRIWNVGMRRSRRGRHIMSTLAASR